MSHKVVVRFHQETKAAMESIATEKGWKTPYLISLVIEDTVPEIDKASYKVIKDEFRNLKKGYREQTAAKQMSLYISDESYETICEIAENHRDRTVFPATVIRDIIIRWLEREKN